jgi:hypothetical protein
MSAQTTFARAERDHWRDQWAAHRKVCSACAMAARRRKPAAMCQPGREINAAHADAQAALGRELAADQASSPDQAALFALPGGRKHSLDGGGG